MNVIEFLQNLVGQLPGPLQPLVSALAGMIPFIEGEGGAMIGIVGGVPPVLAALAAMAGNFLVVAGLVTLGTGAREAVVTRRRAKVPATVGGAADAELLADGTPLAGADDATADAEPADSRRAVRRAKFQRAYERYGVPGVSLLGPLLLPTHVTATMLAATGVGKVRILIWQAAAIIGWTTLTALIATGVLHVVM